MAKTPHSLSDISDASTTANVVSHAAQAASGAPFSHGTVVETGSIVDVGPVAPVESALCDTVDLLHADNTTSASTKARCDFLMIFFIGPCTFTDFTSG